MNHQSQRTKVVILGAGCSFQSSYPLAQQTRGHLQQFADAIADTAPRVCNLVRQTVDLFDRLEERRCPVDTLDELARSIHEGKLTGSSPFPTVQARQGIEAERLVREAKIAVATLFLSKEASTAQRDCLDLVDRPGKLVGRFRGQES